jgi:hypothetical protein
MKRKELNKAFAELRKIGYFAKQNHTCCQTCGWAEVPDEKGDTAVFYHRQDADDLRENGACNLAWSGDGKLITDILTKHGVKVDWDGSSNKRIGININ